MKRLLLAGLLLSVTLGISACAPRNSYRGSVVLDGEHVLNGVDGDLVITGGQVTLVSGARVTGSVYLLSGVMNVEGEIEGDAWALGGELRLLPRSRIDGNLMVAGDTVQRAPQATILGTVNAGIGDQLPLSAGWWERQSPVSQSAWLLGRALFIAVVAFLLALLAGAQATRVADAGLRHPMVSGALGLLTAIVALSLLVFMAFTIILIPVALLGLFALGLMTLFGGAALSIGLSRMLFHRFKWNVALPTAAFLGTLLFALALGLIGLVPLIGAPFSSTVAAASGVIGLGATLLTRFGNRAFIPSMSAMPA